MLEKTYQSDEIERKRYEEWEQDGDFKIGGDRANADPYTIVIPPPNVTGSLHMGHALNNTLAGHPYSLPAHAGPGCFMAAGYGPCGYRHTDGC